MPNMKDPLVQAFYTATYKLADEQLEYILERASEEELRHFHIISRQELPSLDEFVEGLRVSHKYVEQYNHSH